MKMKKEMKSKIKMKRENKVKSTVNDLDTGIYLIFTITRIYVGV